MGNQKVKSIIVPNVTVRTPFITYSSQNTWNFLDMEGIMIKEDDKSGHSTRVAKMQSLQNSNF